MLFMQCYLWSTVQGRVGSWEGRPLLILHLQRLAPRPQTVRDRELLLLDGRWQLFSNSTVPHLVWNGFRQVWRITIAFKIKWRLVDVIREVYLVWFIFLSFCVRLRNEMSVNRAGHRNDRALNCTVTTNQCRDSLSAYLVHSLPIPSGSSEWLAKYSVRYNIIRISLWILWECY